MRKEQIFRSDCGSVHSYPAEAIAADLCHWVAERGRMMQLELKLDPDVAALMVQNWSDVATILQQARDGTPRVAGVFKIHQRAIEDQRHADDGTQR